MWRHTPVSHNIMTADRLSGTNLDYLSTIGPVSWSDIVEHTSEYLVLELILKGKLDMLDP